jgi:hypothetical protein
MQRLHAGDRLQDVSNRTRQAVGRAGGTLRHPATVAAIFVAVVYVIGSRNLFFGRVPEVGSLRDWPGLGALVDAFTAPWQRAGLGVAAPATPAFAFMAALSSLFFGDTDLARTFVVVGAVPIGAFGVYRAARPFARSAVPAVAAAVAYAVNPVARNAIAQGRLGSLVLFAIAPFLLVALLRASGVGTIGDDATQGRVKPRSVVGIALVTAIVAAFFPAGGAFLLVVAVALLVAAPLVGGARPAARNALVALVTTLAAAVLLVPWLANWFDGDGAALGFVPREALGLGDVLRFATGPAGAGWAPWGLLVAGALPLLVATGARLAWAARLWALVVVSYALAWLPSRLDASIARPEPEGVLVAAALGLALATGLGVAAFADDLRQFLFGWRQFAAVAATFGILLPVIGIVGDSVGGRWRMPARDWPDAVSWMDDEQRHGDFRVLWLGDADVLPVAPRASHDTAYGLSRNGTGDVRNSFAAPAGEGEPVLDDALGLLAQRQTARFGHLLAPMGVRYVALVRRSAPGAGIVREFDPAVKASLGEQLDLAVVQAEDDMMLYENRAWAPVRTVVPEETNVDAPDGAIESALRAEIAGAPAVRGDLGASRVPEPGTLLYGEGYDERWSATSDRSQLEHRRAFGWSNAFAGAEGTVDVHFDAPLLPRALRWAEVVLWAALLAWWFAARRRGASEARP